jgi:uncharacterized protein YkwD
VGAIACALLVLIAVIGIGTASAEVPVVGGGCAHANTLPGHATTKQLRRATLCLINKARTVADVGPLKLNSDLTRMAKHHTKTMLAQECLKHRCAGEHSLRRRLKQSGYVDNATKWAYAEDLGYESTPSQMVGRWLTATLDARNLLSSSYDDVGIGPVRGAAGAGVDDAGFVTYTIDLGWRKVSSLASNSPRHR